MTARNARPTPRGAGGARQNTERARRITEEVASSAKVPGMSVAVASPAGLLYADAVGYADLAERRESTVEDQYPWFSMTKIATATAVVRLHAAGQLDLDAPIGTYLSEYRGSSKHGHPTTRQLLTHTAGLANPLPIRWVRSEEQPDDPAFSGRIMERHGTPKRPVGGRAAYSNIGYLLAGEVLAAVTGLSVQDAVRDAVLQPLRMDGTGYVRRAQAPRAVGYVHIPSAVVPVLRQVLPDGIMGQRVDGHTALRPFLVSGAAYGGLVGTVTDAARLAAAHAAGPSDAHPVLDHGDIVTMRAIGAAGKRFDHGIGWFRKPADAHRTPAFVEHYGTGLGFWNAMRIYPEPRLAIVAMTNTSSTWDFDNLFTQLEELSWH
jgi:CubicO group peptidase (beta-lactamase class C family)